MFIFWSRIEEVGIGENTALLFGNDDEEEGDCVGEEDDEEEEELDDEFALDFFGELENVCKF